MNRTVQQTQRKPDVVVLSCNPQVVDLLHRWMNDGQVHCQFADTGYDAKAALEKDTSQILITDRVVPPWPGLGSIRTVKAEFRLLEVAYLDVAAREPIILARFSGADQVLSWPLERHILMHWIKSLSSDRRLGVMLPPFPS